MRHSIDLSIQSTFNQSSWNINCLIHVRLHRTYRPTFPTTIINKYMIFTTQVYNCGIDCTYSFLFASNRIIWLGNHVTHEFDHVFTKLYTLVKFLPQWKILDVNWQDNCDKYQFIKIYWDTGSSLALKRTMPFSIVWYHKD